MILKHIGFLIISAMKYGTLFCDGRRGKKDKAKFYNYSYASVLESLNWNEKAKVRALLSSKEYDKIFTNIQKLPKAINSLIKFANEKLKV